MAWIGADVSKGFIDVLCVSSNGEQGPLHRFDDTPSGHQSWWAYLDECLAHHGCVHVGVESTGGLERNWMRSVSRWRGDRSKSVASCHLVDPRAVHRLAGSLPDRCKTDPSSARAIADYLRLMEGRLSNGTLPPAERAYFRSMMSLQTMASKLVNQIKSLLPEVHPVLVAATQASGIPNWVLAVLKRYPTCDRLARARVSVLEKIPHVTAKRAEKLIRQAKATPVALGGPMAEAQMCGLVDAYQRQQALVDGQWKMLEERFKENADYRRLLTISGLGVKTACAWLAELPPATCFRSANALVGFVGLDPVFEQSGDGVVQKGISHRGSPELRQLLYMAARSGVTCNPILRAFYQRLRAAGKRHDQALVACMAKLVRIAYACLVSETDFDPQHECENTKRADKVDGRTAKEPLGRAHARVAGQQADSPVSPRERRRRQQKQQQDAQRDHSLKGTGCPAAVGEDDHIRKANGQSETGLKCSG